MLEGKEDWDAEAEAETDMMEGKED